LVRQRSISRRGAIRLVKRWFELGLIMRVTVAVPCYNGSRYIARTIESLLVQTRVADEIIVVDDGSVDDSAQIAQSYPVCLVQHAENRGLSAARNTAIVEASGEILAFLDVDAFADPDWLTALLSGYTDPHIAGVGGQGIETQIHSLADRWRQCHASQGHGKIAKDVDFLFGMSMSFRRSTLQTVGGFNTVFRTNAEDMDISFRLRAVGYRLFYQPAARVYHQRVDDEQSLKRTMAAWYRGAYYAKYINRQRPWTLFGGTLRRMFLDPLVDIVNKRDFMLAKLSWQIGWVKLAALIQAMKNTKLNVPT